MPLLSLEDRLAPALRKLELHARFTADDRAALYGLPFAARSMEASRYLVREQDRITNCSVLLSGFAFRSKIVGNGGRQILSMHIPGDILDLQHAFLGVADHNIQMLSAGEVAYVAVEAVRDLAFARPIVGHAMWIDTLIEGSIFREWIANVGRRNAKTRVAHFLCEIAVRFQAAGLTTGNRYELPMTQEQLGDATGLTPVHVNRTLQVLRGEGVISRAKQTITIENWKALSDIGDFATAYLHSLAPLGSRSFSAEGYHFLR